MLMSSILRSCLIVLALLTGVSSWAAANAADSLVVEQPWARESPPGSENGAVYMTIVNHGQATDRLLGASGEVAARIGLHAHLMEDGVMKMRPVQSIEIEPGASAVLEPGGLHIMLMGLKEPLKAGQTFPLTLSFEKAGEMSVEVSVRGLNDAMGGHMHHGGSMKHQ